MGGRADCGRAIRLAAACTECQRRKQKCSREWPCNHCQARRLSHLCRFAPKNVPRASRRAIGEPRALRSHQENLEEFGQDSSPSIDTSIGISAQDFRVLGYLPDRQNLQVGSPSPEVRPHGARQPVNLWKSSSIKLDESQILLSPEMDNALHVLPPKPYTDILVQNFLCDTNYHYYCLYPPKFSDDYSNWWAKRASGQTTTPEFTCLLLRVCACSAQFLNPEARQKLEMELGERTQSLTERYHRAAQRLSSTISPGRGSLIQVQQLFLTASWLKTEAQFIDSWHTLAAAIHAAQELGMHKSSFGADITEFECEMRRRVWCLLYTWDWQMSALLSRPLIINDSCCSFELPNMLLENPDAHTEMPSPVAHMVFQCQLRRAVSKIPGLAADTLTPAHASAIQAETEKWLASFPPYYRVIDPDIQWEKECRYVALQRCQLHIVGYMTMLCPLKSCLTSSTGSNIPDAERSLRTRAVDLSLKLVDASRRLFELIFPTTAKFHFAIFLIFDTAALLCSAVIHDNNHSLPHRDKVIEAIGSALSMMQQLSQLTKGGAICYSILSKLAAGLSFSPQERTVFCSLFPANSGIGPKFSETQIHEGTPSPAHVSTPNAVSNLGMHSTGVDTSAFLDIPVPEIGLPQTMSLGDIANFDVGELGQIWDWENLGLNL